MIKWLLNMLTQIKGIKVAKQNKVPADYLINGRRWSVRIQRGKLALPQTPIPPSSA